MRIGFFTDSYLPTTHGVEVSVETFRKTLEDFGHKVIIYAPYAPNYKDEFENVFRFYSLKIIRKPEIRLAFPFLPKDFPRSLNKILKLKLDICHSHTPFSMGLLAYYISKYQKTPLIYTHHTNYDEYSKVYFKGGKVLVKLAKLYTLVYCNFADVIIVPSQKVKTLLISYGVDKQKTIYILPTGVDTNVFKKDKKTGLKIRKKFNIPLESKVLIFVGRMSGEKNPEFILKTMKELLNIRNDLFLLMIGEGKSLASLKRISKSLGIDHRVIFTGAVNHKFISDYYNASDVFVFSSLTETQGIVILEAMACGLPVVVLEDDAFKDMIIDNKNGFLIKNNSIDDFVKKIIDILNNKSLFERLSRSAREIAVKYSKRNQAEKLIKIYEDALKSFK